MVNSKSIEGLTKDIKQYSLIIDLRVP
jgi:hypothetical protein